MRSSSDCGADLSELLGRMCEKPSLSSMAFSRGRWLSRESWNTPMPFSLGLLTSAVLYCVLKVQSKGIGSCSPREREAWKCQLGHAEATGRLISLWGAFLTLLLWRAPLI